jgi:hypothetical protein
MLAYYISQSNNYTLRTQPTASSQFTMNLQDMTTLVNLTASLSGINYVDYESILEFTASISGTNIGEEYRATIINSGSTEPIWNGSIQVYQSESLNTTYTNQNNQYVSHITDNEFIIM